MAATVTSSFTNMLLLPHDEQYTHASTLQHTNTNAFEQFQIDLAFGDQSQQVYYYEQPNQQFYSEQVIQNTQPMLYNDYQNQCFTSGKYKLTESSFQNIPAKSYINSPPLQITPQKKTVNKFNFGKKSSRASSDGNISDDCATTDYSSSGDKNDLDERELIESVQKLQKNQKGGKNKKKFNTKEERLNFVKSYQMKFKTELCKNWELYGTCRFKNSCAFAHGAHELKNKQHVPANYKSKTCKQFNENMFCPYGSRNANGIGYENMITENAKQSALATAAPTTEPNYVSLFQKPRLRCFVKLASKASTIEEDEIEA